MSANHTPGPWMVTGLGGPWERSLKIRANKWGCVAQVGVDPGMPHWDGPQRANAALIAAAPELLTLLQNFVSDFATTADADVRAYVNGALALIADATPAPSTQEGK